MVVKGQELVMVECQLWIHQEYHSTESFTSLLTERVGTGMLETTHKVQILWWEPWDFMSSP